MAFRVLRSLQQADAERWRRTGGGPEAATLAGAGAEPAAAPRRGSVVVCDINPAMLLEGRKRAAAQGIDAYDLEWVESSAETLPFPDESMDSYTISFGIRNVTDRDAALREAYR